MDAILRKMEALVDKANRLERAAELLEEAKLSLAAGDFDDVRKLHRKASRLAGADRLLLDLKPRVRSR